MKNATQHNTKSVRAVGLFPWSLIGSHLGIMWANDTQSVFLCRLLTSGLVAVTVENLASHTCDGGNGNNCVSISSSTSSMCRVTVVAHRGTCDMSKNFTANVFLRRKERFSPIVNGLLGLAIRLAFRYDALGALAVVDVEALTNCFCSCSCFFPSKYSEGLLLMQSAWSPSSEAVLKASSRSPHITLWWMGISCRDKSIFEVDLVCELQLSS